MITRNFGFRLVRFFFLLGLLTTWGGLALRAEPATTPDEKQASESGNSESEESSDTGIVPSWQTRGGARTVDLMIPAPRGQIVDRDGRPLATNRVAYFPGLKFPNLANSTDQQIGAYGLRALNELNVLCWGDSEAGREKYFERDVRDFIEHYHNRRWLPFLLAGRYVLNEDQKKAIDRDLGSAGLVSYPIYLRHYPEDELASHIIGYTGLKRPLPTGPLADGDPLFFEWEGKSGLEASFDEELSGKPGRLNVIFDADGKEIARDLLYPPEAGTTLVTTLDADMQALAEDVLYFRSSMVVMDSQNGEILAMASEPGYNLNDFVPSISEDAFAKLINDSDNPLYGRAFQASYPPASTFKLPIAIAALKSGTITPNSEFDCPGTMKIGNDWKDNWNRKGEGRMDLRRAIARSCNTWYYAVGPKVGADALIQEAHNFGFGQLTKIPLDENPGLLPQGHKMYLGDVANFSIGQGIVEATPLQVAQSMTGIANGTDIWRARLIRQEQNNANAVTEVFGKESVGRVEMSEKLLQEIRQGMEDVVHASHGTGKQGYCSHARTAAKTGTAEWKGTKKMTWFAGFIPADDPQFTFAIAFEGGSSGGATVAPLAKRFFNSLYGRRDPAKDLFAHVRPPGGEKTAQAADDDDDKPQTSSRKKRTTKRTAKRPSRVSAPKPAPQPRTMPAKPAKKRSFLDRLFGRD